MSSLLSIAFGDRSFFVNLLIPQIRMMYRRGTKNNRMAAARRANSAKYERKGTLKSNVLFCCDDDARCMTSKARDEWRRKGNLKNE